jgi:hypothetical protein
MIYQNIINTAYNALGSTGGTELLGDSDLVFFLNNGLSFIDMRMDWPFLKTEKTITPTSASTTFTLPTELYVVYEVNGVLDGEEHPLHEAGRPQQDDNTYKLYNRTIVTKESYDAIKIYGNWGIATVENNETSLSQEIELPRGLLFALYNLILAQAMPVFLDNGFQISTYYYNTANNAIDGAIRKYSTQSGTKNIRPVN